MEVGEPSRLRNQIEPVDEQDFDPIQLTSRLWSDPINEQGFDPIDGNDSGDQRAGAGVNTWQRWVSIEKPTVATRDDGCVTTRRQQKALAWTGKPSGVRVNVRVE
jgi:hypothetical protein